MAELSKTARASMGKVVKEVKVETIDEAIKAIRDNRAAGLFIGDMSRIDKLLADRDALLKLTDRLIKENDELKQRVVKIEDDTIIEQIAMSEIPAQEHDEHHMVDFGHHTTHPIAEGA